MTHPLRIQWESRPPADQPRVVTNYSLESAYLTSTDGWSATLYDTDQRRLANLGLEPVQLFVHDNPQVTGRIEQVERGSNGTSVKVSGRDYFADVVECNADPTLKLTKDMSLQQALGQALGPMGIDSILGDGDVALRSIRSGATAGTKSPRKLKELRPGELKPESGMGLYDFCNRFAARLGATLQPTTRRNEVLVTAPDYAQSPLHTIRRSLDPSDRKWNNVISATATEDYSSFPTVALVTGRINATGAAAKSAQKEYDVVAQLVAIAESLSYLSNRVVGSRQKPGAVGDVSKLYRLLYVNDKSARSAEQVERALFRAVSERLKNTLVYEVELQGHADDLNGLTYAVDTMVRVSDDVCQIHEDLWVAERRFSYSPGQGTRTRLVCWRPGSFYL